MRFYTILSSISLKHPSAKYMKLEQDLFRFAVKMDFFKQFTITLRHYSMEDLEIGVDPAEAERRVARLRQEEEEARKKELEEQKREAKLAFHRAVAARRKFYEMNKEVVKKLKDEVRTLNTGLHC
jgi:hypothetical protein